MPFSITWNLRIVLPLAVLLTCLLAGDTHAQNVKTQHPKAVASESQPAAADEADSTAKLLSQQTQLIEQWATQLDDDQFITRQQAQRSLQEIGLPAIHIVNGVAETGMLESSSRAVKILQHWTETQPLALRLAALQALAQLPNHPRESAQAALLLNDFHRKAAVEILTKLNARIEPDSTTHGLNNLQVVIGPDWRGNNADLQHLAAIPNLTTLSFYGAPLGDSALQALPQLPGLQRLEIYSTNKISPAAIKKLEQKRPRVNVETRKGALLGVKSQPLENTISEVTPGSAADKAGIKRLDQITEFNGAKVNNFSELTKKISDCFPGDTAKLTVLRGNKTLQLKVTFDDWAKADVTTLNQWPRQQLPPLVPRRPILLPRVLPAAPR